MTEEDCVDLLVSIFEWDNSLLSRYSALRILRGARGIAAPSWDDYQAGIVR